MKKILAIQFGNQYQKGNPEYIQAGRTYSNPCFLWIHPVSEYLFVDPEDYEVCPGVPDPILAGYAFSDKPASFLIGLPDSTYRVTVTFFCPEKDYGPFSIKASGDMVLESVQVKTGVIRKETFECKAKEGLLELEFIPDEGKDFVINALIVEGNEKAALHQIFKTAPPAEVPDRDELLSHPADEPQKVLKGICDWLLENRRYKGFIGDGWNDTDGKVVLYWYTMSMPLRALLSGYDILGNKKYLDTCIEVLDTFVGEQLPNGAWTEAFRGQPTASLSMDETEHIMATYRQPLSDIGSVVGILAVACKYVPQDKKEAYLKAICDFCDNWAPRFILPSGAFGDGIGLGDGVYTCATAIEASVFSLAWHLTGNTRYMETAEKAIVYLLEYWREDGLMTMTAPYFKSRSCRTGKPFLHMQPLNFGDMWYYDEGFITAWYHSNNDAFRSKVNKALEWRVFGKDGLINALDGKVWWPVRNIWNNAKSLGMVQTLLHMKVHGKLTPALEEALNNMKRFLCTYEYSRRLGVMPDDMERPASLYSLQTWSGMAMEATGFAGMTLAEIIKPGILYLKT